MLIIEPGQTHTLPTGIAIEITENRFEYDLLNSSRWNKGIIDGMIEAQIRSRSGLAARNGIHILNSPGTVDNGYTGELKLIIHNAGNFNFPVKHGDRLAQLVFCPVLLPTVSVVEEFEKISNRGENGIGSSGINAR